MCIYLWLWRCFGKNSSLWQISHTRRLLNLGKVRASGMKIHESSFLLLLYLLKLDQTFTFSWILLVSMMLSQFFDYVTTYNLNYWIWHPGFGNYGDTYWTNGWFLVFSFTMQIVAFRLWTFLEPFLSFEF